MNNTKDHYIDTGLSQSYGSLSRYEFPNHNSERGLYLKLGENMMTYWQILENSSRNFSEISVFRVRAYYWKSHPFFNEILFFKFFEYLFGFCQISFHELDRFLENSSTRKAVKDCLDEFSRNFSVSRPVLWTTFPEIGSRVITHEILMDEFSMNRSSSCA